MCFDENACLIGKRQRLTNQFYPVTFRAVKLKVKEVKY